MVWLIVSSSLPKFRKSLRSVFSKDPLKCHLSPPEGVSNCMLGNPCYRSIILYGSWAFLTLCIIIYYIFSRWPLYFEKFLKGICVVQFCAALVTQLFECMHSVCKAFDWYRRFFLTIIFGKCFCWNFCFSCGFHTRTLL